MARVVGVHGVGQQFLGEHLLDQAWCPAIRDGLAHAGFADFDPMDFRSAFYGNLFRPTGTKAVTLPPYEAADVREADEQALLMELWRGVGESEQAPSPPAVKLGTPGWVQAALTALSRSRFFGGIAEHVLIGDLKQVTAYFHRSDLRRAARDRVVAAIDATTRVLIGHSLGSVVAYEALCHHPNLPIRAFVTLGSPLGIRNVIFDRLDPHPVDGHGRWPGQVSTWTNIADRGDVVALVKSLAGCFDPRVQDRLVHNGARAHDASPYLTARETGEVIAAGLVA